MRLTAACLILIASSLFSEAALDPDDPEADSILDAVVARLPQTPLDIHGKLTVRRPRGIPVQELGFDMTLRWGQTPSTATYTIRDAFDTVLEQMTFVRDAEAAVQVAYAAGDPPRETTAPNLASAIQKTDLSWVDISLAFLWWRHAVLVGQESIRGRACFVIDAPAPAAATPALSTDKTYAAVRLWIDRELLMLLQAESYDASAALQRRLWVKSFKKIDERWMIKDMEIQSFPVVHRTKLRIQEVNERDDQ